MISIVLIGAFHASNRQESGRPIRLLEFELLYDLHCFDSVVPCLWSTQFSEVCEFVAVQTFNIICIVGIRSLNLSNWRHLDKHMKYFFSRLWYWLHRSDGFILCLWPFRLEETEEGYLCGKNNVRHDQGNTHEGDTEHETRDQDMYNSTMICWVIPFWQGSVLRTEISVYMTFCWVHTYI
jgi:hypothetical protein